MQAATQSHSQLAGLEDYISVDSNHGLLYRIPEDIFQAIHIQDTPVPTVFQSRSPRPHRIRVSRAQDIYETQKRVKSSQRSKVFIFLERLADSTGKQLFRSLVASSAHLDPNTEEPIGSPSTDRSSIRRPLSWGSGVLSEQPRLPRRPYSSKKGGTRRQTPQPPDDMRLTTRPAIPSNTAVANSIMVDEDSSLYSSPTLDSFPNTGQRIPDEKPIATANGFTVSIALAEPCLFLQGFDQNELLSNRSTAMLRGSLHLKVTKPSKMKSISLKFTGKAWTSWPEGIPPKQVENEETNIFMSHTWPFFNAQFPMAEYSTGADHVELRQKPEPTVSKRISKDMGHFLRMNSSNTSLGKPDKRSSIGAERPRSFVKEESVPGGSIASKGFKTLIPGDYIYNFELPLDSHLPETTNVERGYVKYELEANVERPGTFNKKVTGTKEVLLIRTPSETSLEQVEPIAISRNWDDQLHYEIVISGKSFPLGSQIPVAVKLTPLAKVQCHRVKVYITESIEMWCANKRVHRTEAQRRMLLFEKRADGPPTSTFAGSTMRVVSGGGIPYDLRAAAARGEIVNGLDSNNLLGNLEGADATIGPTEMEINVQLPTCADLSKADSKSKLHFDTTYSNIQVHHWIKIVLRISRPDANDPAKRRHFEISIDSPFHILSCRATQTNTALPAYSYPDPINTYSPTQQCGCPGAPLVPPHMSSISHSIAQFESSARNSCDISTPTILRPPPAAHVNGDSSPSNATAQHADILTHAPRPMHIIRAPSYNPPAFDDEEPPPPLMTPPPEYNDIASPTTGLADYFTRLSDAHATEDAAAEAVLFHSNGNPAVINSNSASVNAAMVSDDLIGAEETVVIDEATRSVTRLDVSDSDSDAASTPTQRSSVVADHPTILAALVLEAGRDVDLLA